MRAIMARPDLGYRIVGFLDDDPDKAHAEHRAHSPGLGSTEALVEAITASTGRPGDHRPALGVLPQDASDRARR